MRNARRYEGYEPWSRTVSRRRRAGEIEVDVIGHDQVEFAVAVVIHERAAGAPILTRSCDCGLFANFCEHTVVVVVEPILPVIRDVEIFPTVIVVIAHANTLSPSRCRQAGFLSHISKCAIVVVAIETVRRSFTGGKTFEPGPVHQENVRPAVVVVIENRDAVSGCLDDVLLGIDSAEYVLRGEACLFGDVSEVGYLYRCRRNFGLLSAQCSRQKDNSQSCCQPEIETCPDARKLKSHELNRC